MPGADAILRERIAARGGAIPFEEFMRIALYHPEAGYYSRNIREVGRRGDFSTTATLSDDLARAIAAWVLDERPARGRWHLIEVGAGGGELACGVLSALGWWARRRMCYHIVETSAPLRDQQAKRLGRRVSWHETMREALEATGHRALIFSNELVDAFPCRVVAWNGEGWDELFLECGDRCFRETFRPLATAPDSTACELPAPRTGQRFEIHSSYRDWLREWAPEWNEGSMLTIDYGGEAAEVYHRRPRGTLRAFAHHMRFEGDEVYARPGQQDITADVNFSDLRRWGVELGFENAPLMSQREFIGTADGAAADFLTAAPGAGDAFSALIQQVPCGSPRSTPHDPGAGS